MNQKSGLTVLQQNQAIIVVAFIVLCSTYSVAEQNYFSQGQWFPVTGILLPSPSEKMIGILRPDVAYIIRWNESSRLWEGLYESPVGGYSVNKSNLGATQPPSEGEPAFGWVTKDGNNEHLVLQPRANIALGFDGEELMQSTHVDKIRFSLDDSKTGRLRRYAVDGPRPSVDAVEQYIRHTLGLIPDDIQAGLVEDIHASTRRILFRPEIEAPITIRDLNTTNESLLTIGGGRPRVLGRDMHGSFSPDGNYILMQFSYGPDDHHAGGFLQLFNSQGQFLEEIAVFSEEAFAPVGSHVWMDSNWIVFTDGEKTGLKKFLAEGR